uniref:Kinesin-like protein n=1 Tax=Marsilea vestita TaxID=59764 RepID=A0A142KWC3_MARVE|nr:kinesin 13c protein [Marsilea vestita]
MHSSTSAHAVAGNRNANGGGIAVVLPHGYQNGLEASSTGHIVQNTSFGSHPAESIVQDQRSISPRSKSGKPAKGVPDQRSRPEIDIIDIHSVNSELLTPEASEGQWSSPVSPFVPIDRDFRDPGTTRPHSSPSRSRSSRNEISGGLPFSSMDRDFQETETNKSFTSPGRNRSTRSEVSSRPVTADRSYRDLGPAKIKVVVRKRPINKKEITRGEEDIITVADSANSLIVHEPKLKVDLTAYVEKHEFVFDAILDENVTNHEVYLETVEPIIPGLFQQTKATCFAYGQTGSGKTFTMRPLPLKASEYILYLMQQPGYIEEGFQLWLSFFEIYGGKLFDLLNGKSKLCMREDGRQQVCIVGLKEFQISSLESLKGYIDLGSSARSTGSTGANEESSRSHAILQLCIKRPQESTDKKRSRIVGKMSFIDLAGSERGADTTDNDRQTRLEGAEINKSLLALKECIRALDSDQNHIPFRGSKLTEVLRDSFVGNSKTVMISCISPSSGSCEHTLNTLRYADRVKGLSKNSNSKRDLNSLMSIPTDASVTSLHSGSHRSIDKPPNSEATLPIRPHTSCSHLSGGSCYEHIQSSAVYKEALESSNTFSPRTEHMQQDNLGLPGQVRPTLRKGIKERTNIMSGDREDRHDDVAKGPHKIPLRKIAREERTENPNLRSDHDDAQEEHPKGFLGTARSQSKKPLREERNQAYSSLTDRDIRVSPRRHDEWQEENNKSAPQSNRIPLKKFIREGKTEFSSLINDSEDQNRKKFVREDKSCGTEDRPEVVSQGLPLPNRMTRKVVREYKIDTSNIPDDRQEEIETPTSTYSSRKSDHGSSLYQEEDYLVSAHCKQLEDTINFVREEMKLIALVDQPGSQITDYVTRLSVVLSKKAEGLVKLQGLLARFQQLLKEREVLGHPSSLQTSLGQN